MLSFILKRLALIVPTFLGITLLVFGLIRLIPGDPVEAMSGERGMTQERYERLVHEFGLDRPLYVQYGEYVWKALHADLGQSIKTREPVFSEFIDRFPNSVDMGGMFGLDGSQIGELLIDIILVHEDFTKLNESPHDRDVHLDRSLAMKDAR